VGGATQLKNLSSLEAPMSRNGAGKSKTQVVGAGLDRLPPPRKGKWIVARIHKAWERPRCRKLIITQLSVVSRTSSNGRRHSNRQSQMPNNLYNAVGGVCTYLEKLNHQRQVARKRFS